MLLKNLFQPQKMKNLVEHYVSYDNKIALLKRGNPYVN